MNNNKIKVLVNIKTIGWTSLIIFGLIFYLLTSQFIGLELISSKEPFLELYNRKEFNDIRLLTKMFRDGLIVIITFLALLIIASIGILKLNGWGRILYHSSSIIIILGILGALAYFLYNYEFLQNSKGIFGFDAQIAHEKSFILIQKFQIISKGVFLIIITWILTRVNVLLFNDDYRKEFI